MGFFEFFHQHWFLAFMAMYFVSRWVIELITLCKLPLRAYMVAKAGWPPEYLDADGDTHHKKEPPTQQGE